ncbi:MAG: N-acylglucosamine 2-epimerase [bacterium]|nr:N-acylglucosamine 2-epimerase [bacterium]
MTANRPDGTLVVPEARGSFRLQEPIVNRDRLVQLAAFHHAALVGDVLPFWAGHGLDRECGGCFTCLERDGTVYSTDKAVWHQGRAGWVFATAYRLVEPRTEWLELARSCCDFLDRHCFDEQGKAYFSVTRDGRPLRMRRYVFSEVFACLAFAALAAATGDVSSRARAIELFDSFCRCVGTPGAIEPKTDMHTRPCKSLAPLMCLLHLADTMLLVDDDPRYERVLTSTIGEVLGDFVDSDDGVVLETVGPSGQRLDAPEGRVMNPGHTIETAWFLMEIARRRGDDDLAGRSRRLLDWSFDRGWDETHGGLFYYIDVAGKPSPYLEHDMKLWWPHCEALYAALLAHEMTNDAHYARMYEQAHDWTFAHFPDADCGEWFGYLHRDGTRSTDLKGNLWKGPYHVPRALMLCWNLLREMTT